MVQRVEKMTGREGRKDRTRPVHLLGLTDSV